MNQAISIVSYDSCLVYQHKDIKEIKRNLNKNFSDDCDWFVDNKLSIHFEGDKTKCILFGTKYRLKSVVLILKVSSLNIKFSEIHIKQYHTVTYLDCSLVETLSEEPMALKIIIDSDFYIEKTGSCLRLFADCFRIL